MARAKYQVLVIPYLKENERILYCVFKRKDMENCWQFIAGGGEDEDESPLFSAKRESFEEAHISMKSHITPLETTCSIATECFKEARLIWGEDCLVIPEYSFAVELKDKKIEISSEHLEYDWVDYETARARLNYDSNRVALWELNNKLQSNTID